MRIPKNISNEDLLKIIEENLNWTRLSQKNFYEGARTHLAMKNFLSKKQRKILLSIASKIASKRKITHRFESYRASYFKNLKGIQK